MVADEVQVMDYIKYGICSFYVRHNLTVGFPYHWDQYGHYFIRQLNHQDNGLSLVRDPSASLAHSEFAMEVWNWKYTHI
jgi:hypothetical protein